MARLEGLKALITGGGRGIGKATAFLFAREGAVVGILGKGKTSLDAAQTEAAAQGLKFLAFVADVGDKDAGKRAVADFVAATGGLDILVNNAGVSIGRPFLEKTVEEWNEVLRVNLIGTFLMCQAAAPHLRASKSGRIVNVSSVRGLDHVGREGIMDYSAAKAGVINLTRTMAKEFAPTVTVNAVTPGNTMTDLLRAVPEEVKTAMLAGTYLKRFGTPEDIANGILYLASPEAAFVTGHNLVVDGGFSLK
jgi:3-oxoacyl-[acyl-carrier protein] reductase